MPSPAPWNKKLCKELISALAAGRIHRATLVARTGETIQEIPNPQGRYFVLRQTCSNLWSARIFKKRKISANTLTAMICAPIEPHAFHLVFLPACHFTPVWLDSVTLVSILPEAWATGQQGPCFHWPAIVSAEPGRRSEHMVDFHAYKGRKALTHSFLPRLLAEQKQVKHNLGDVRTRRVERSHWTPSPRAYF